MKKFLVAFLFLLLQSVAQAQLAPTPAPSGLTANNIQDTGPLSAASLTISGAATVGSFAVGSLTGCSYYSSGTLSISGGSYCFYSITATSPITSSNSSGPTTNISCPTCITTSGGTLSALTVTGATSLGSTSISSGLSMTNTTSNDLTFPIYGVGAPTFTTTSAGERIQFYPLEDSSHVNFGAGIASNTLWFSLPQAVSGYTLTLYGGTTSVLTIDGTGKVSANSLSISGASTLGSAKVLGNTTFAYTTTSAESPNVTSVLTATNTAACNGIVDDLFLIEDTSNSINSIGGDDNGNVAICGAIYPLGVQSQGPVYGQTNTSGSSVKGPVPPTFAENGATIASTYHCIYQVFTASSTSSTRTFTSSTEAPFSNADYVLSVNNDTSNSYNPTTSSKSATGFTLATTSGSVYSYTACGT